MILSGSGSANMRFGAKDVCQTLNPLTIIKVFGDPASTLGYDPAA
jgi:hypothetical protein